MKKVVCIICAVVMTMMVCVTTNAEETRISFETYLTDLFGLNAKEWMEDGITRALLTITLCTGVAIDSEVTYEPQFNESSYVGRVGTINCVVVPTNSEDYAIFIIYDSYRHVGEYMCGKFSSLGDFDQAAQAMLSAACTDGYYKNYIVDIIEATSVFKEVLDSLK